MNDTAEANTLLARAAAEYAAGRMNEAMHLVAKAERTAPDQPSLLELKGAIAVAQGRPQEAAAALSRAADRARDTLGRETVGLRLSQATALELAGDPAAAVAALNAARTAVAANISELLSADLLKPLRAQLADIDTRLARLHWALGRHDEAITAQARLADASPDDIAMLGRLAGMLAWRHRLLEGLAVCLHLAALQPAAGEAARNVGEFLIQLGHPAAAQPWLRLALDRDPADTRAAAALATAAAQPPAPPPGAVSRLLAATTTLATSQAQAAAHIALADALLEARDAGIFGPDWPLLNRGAAIVLLRRAQALQPNQPAGAALLADALAARGDLQDAEAALRAALKQAPLDAGLHKRLAALLQRAWRLEEAAASYTDALGLEPDNPALMTNLANALLSRGPAPRAIALLQRALSLDPHSAEARYLLGVALAAEHRPAEAAQALRTALAARPNVAEWHFALSLAANIPGLAGVYADNEGVPPHDEAIPLLHLPWVFGTTLATIPATVPYLRPDLTRAAAFRRRMQGLPGLKVGLVWSGDPRPHSHLQSTMDRRRSLRLDAFAPLAAIPGLVFVSLQKGAPAAQAATPPDGMVLHDWTSELEDFAATAALMSALDLVISVDTSPAHLAGALGREVWLLNRHDTDWRWLLGRDDSPWYPTLRQFRQATPGDWDGVIARVAEALRAKLA
jgi:tetratricopeptide (TPR) repeat protein